MVFRNVWVSLAFMATALAAPAAQESFDYIIVGGGTAGGALATRLSQGLPKAKILLLEAGPSALSDLRINVPGMRGSILYSELDWNFKTIPQKDLGGRTIDVNRGKVLGGSSAMNYLCYDRGAAAEYDAWGDFGSPGWSFNSMINAMTKSENFTGNDGDVHGRSGPISSTFNRIIFDVLRAWQPTVSKLGIPISDGHSLGGEPIGVMFQPTNIDVTHHTRSYSANSYLPRAGKNLIVRTGSQVAKVLLEKCGTKYQATGVVLADKTVLKAKKEVVLSAGSILSPGLLELSGIGQSQVLKAVGITPLVDLPGVGENYQDHLRTSNTYRLKDGYESFDQYIFNSSNTNATMELQKWKNGERSLYEYTTSAYGFVKWGQVDPTLQAQFAKLMQDSVNSNNVIDQKKLEFLNNPSVPDIELLYEANYVGAGGYKPGNYITLFSTLMHPLSRGSVHINSTNPLAAPIIDPRFLNNEYDIRAVAEGARYMRRIAETEPMRSVWAAETEPGPEVQTDAQFRNFAVSTVNSFYHPVGTCAMLPRADGGVVGADLRVYGTSNLRVVDASVIPIIPSGHIQTAVYGVAEMAAEIIIRGAA